MGRLALGRFVMLAGRMLMAAASGVQTTTIGSVRFDGSNDYLDRNADLTGNADGKVGTVAFWLDLKGGDGGLMRIIDTTNSFFEARRTTSNEIKIRGFNSSSTEILTITSNSTYTASSGLIHVMASWGLANGVTHLYINGSDDEAAGSTATDDNIDYTRANFSIGATTGGTQFLDAEVADFYFTQEYIDLSQAANRQKFYFNGSPVDLGSDGSTPTGNQPIVFQHIDAGGTASDFATNLGYGGGMVERGTLTAGADIS